MAANHPSSKWAGHKFRGVVQIGIMIWSLCLVGFNGTAYAQSAASSAPGYRPNGLSVAPLTRPIATTPSDIRVGLISINGGISTVENALHSTGLLDSSRIDLISNNGVTPTLAQLQAYDAILLWTDNAFQDPDAVGDVLADYIDGGGSLVMATFAFSRSVGNNWWVGGRLISDGYSPFGISDQRSGTSGVLNLSSAVLSHPIFDGITASDNLTYFQNSNFTDPSLIGQATVLAWATTGEKVVAINRTRDVAGISIFPGSNTLSSSNPLVSRLFANALIEVTKGGFGITNNPFVDNSPITVTGVARDTRITSVTIKQGTLTKFAVLNSTSRDFTLDNVDLNTGDNVIIAEGFNAENVLVASDSFTIALDQNIPGILAGPLVIGITDSSTTIAAETDEPATMKVAFGLDPNNLNTDNTVNTTMFKRFHQVELKNLLPSETYHVVVKVIDRAGNESEFVPDIPIIFTTRHKGDKTGPQLLEYPAASGLTRTSAIITAATDEIARATVEIVADDSTQQTTPFSDPNNQFFFRHRISVIGLSGGTTYFARMRFVDANDNETVTGFISFITPLVDDTDPPEITNGPAVLLSTARRTVIVYNTNEPSNTEILVNIPGSTDTTRVLQADLVTDHRAVITNLESGKDYEYRVRSKDFLGNQVTSKRRTFRTNDEDKLTPVITEGPVIGYNGGAVIVVDITTDEPATARLDIAPENDLTDITTTFGGINVTDHHLTLTNLDLNTAYKFVVTVTDPSGNFISFPANGLSAKRVKELADNGGLFKVLQAPGLTGRFTTNQAPDTQAPIVLAGPTVVARTSNSLTVSWATDELSSSAIDYGANGNLGQSTTGSNLVTNHTVTLTNLSPATTYSYRINSRDVAGNGPTQGPLPTLIAAATTTGQPDIKPPVIGNVAVSGITDDRAIITWTTDEPANSFVDFDLNADRLIRNLGISQLRTNHTVTLTNLAPGSTYFYRVRSSDGQGNGPQLSVVRTFTTTGQRDSTPPGISDITLRPGFRSGQITWKTDEPANSFIKVVNGIGDTLSFASSSIVTDHKMTITDTTFLPRGAINYQVYISSTDPSRNTGSEPAQVLTTLATPDITAPAPPSGLTILPGNGALRLSWDANAETDIASYAVYRITGSDTVQVESGITETSFLDEAVLNGTTYTYYVTASDAALPAPNTSGPSGVISGVPSTTTAPTAPTLIAPVNNTEVSVKPLLAIANATTGSSGGSLTYTFAIYSDSTLSQLVASKTGVPEGTENNPTHWAVFDVSLADSVLLDDGARYWWRARASDGTFEGEWSAPGSFIANRSVPTAVLTPESETAALPTDFSLSQNSPNPFNPSTRIRYALPQSGTVTLIVYNILGQQVRKLLDGKPHGAGVYNIDWDGRNRAGSPTSSGVYLYRIEVKGDAGEVFSDIKKMVLVK